MALGQVQVIVFCTECLSSEATACRTLGIAGCGGGCQITATQSTNNYKLNEFHPFESRREVTVCCLGHVRDAPSSRQTGTMYGSMIPF
ncbi:hypothetical protein F4678DRAFT_441943 [Xylaria arbuscula]|nr:hypothetical protein F4678DRAFT_441943 [Xylaria arbuscula]